MKKLKMPVCDSPRGDLLVQLANHDGRDRTANVIALQQDLVAAALADELMPKALEQGRRRRRSQQSEGTPASRAAALAKRRVQA